MGSLNSQSLPSTLRRRNSMTSDLLIPPNLHSSSFPQTSTPKSSSCSSFPPVDLELISLKSLAYTSLKDLLPSLSAVQSPTGVATTHQSVYEIPIRNHLVKQAAWAYLQPMSTSPGSSNRYCFRRLWSRFSTDYVQSPVNACFRFISQHVIPAITSAIDRFLGAIRVRISTTSLIRAARIDPAISDSGAVSLGDCA